MNVKAWFALSIIFGSSGSFFNTSVESFKASAEHGVVTLRSPENKIQIGETFDFMLGYGDSTVLLHDILYGVRQNVVEVAWLIHGRGKTH